MYYILVNGKPVETNDVKTWGEWFASDDRRIARDKVGDSEVSTVFLGIDHQHGEGAPILFETLVFGGEFDEEMERYSTLEQAQAGHKAMVAKVSGSLVADESRTVSIESLTGGHFFSGCDTVNRMVKRYEWQDAENCQVINFILDGTTYTAIEDPSDGYRSSMDKLFVSNEKVENNFAPVQVVGIYVSRSHYNAADIIRFYDVKNGKLVLEVGTDNSDDYYPSFVGSFNPMNMHVNE